VTPWIPTTAVLLALSGVACSGAESDDALTAKECIELGQIAGAADSLFEEGTSVEDLGSAYYLKAHASTNEARLDEYADRVLDNVHEDVETLRTLYADYADSVAAMGLTTGKTPSPSQVESIRDSASIDDYAVDGVAGRVSAWARTNCGS
jgi:hypothetical protein